MVRTALMPAVAVALALVSGCSDGGVADDPVGSATAPAPPTQEPREVEATTEDVVTETAPTTVEPAAEPALTTTTSAPSAQEQDEADIEATVIAYSEALDELYHGGDYEVIHPWTKAVAREQWTVQMRHYREQGTTFAGSTSVEVRSITMTDTGADVLGCVDYSRTSVTDADGQDITPDWADGAMWLNDFVLEREPATEYGWVVVDDTSRDEFCDD